MIVHVAQRGHSFKGAGLYYLHDKSADTSERVAWTHTHNLPTDDPDKGLRWMAHTSMNATRLKEEAGVARTGRKAKGGCVYAFALSWHPEQEPGKEEMMSAAFDTLDRLGLKEHEAVLVAHRDTDHPHVHVICNLVNPKDGRTAVPSYDQLTLSTWAQSYEEADGKIYCEERVKNNEKRREQAKEGRELALVKHKEQKHETAQMIQELYNQSDNGHAFRAALEEAGFALAKGDRRGFVIVDDYGKVHSLSRQLEGQRAKDISARLADLNEESLPSAKAVAEERMYFDRDKYETEWQKQIGDGAVQEEQKKKEGRAEAELTKDAATFTLMEAKGQSTGLNENPHPFKQDDFLKDLDRLREWEQAQDRKRFQLEKELSDFYGRDKLANQLEAMQEQIERNDTFWGRTTGKLRELQDDKERLTKTLTNMDMRISERRNALEAEIERSKEKEFSTKEQERRLEMEERRKRKVEALQKLENKQIDRPSQSHNLSR